VSLAQIEFYGDPCRRCGYSWTAPEGELTALVAGLAGRYRATLEGLDAAARHPDLAWSAGEYVMHVADNLRQHGERFAASVRTGPYVFEGADQDAVAGAREFHLVPLEGALWALEVTTGPYLDAYGAAAATGVALPHATRGDQVALDVLRGNAHDAHHHGWDLGRIAAAAPAR
jgi:hypothetical protein